MMSNPIFTYKIGAVKKRKIEMQINLHGGLNQLLRKNGLPIQSNSYQAIQVAHKNGLIDSPTKQVCCKINHNGNTGKHSWT